MDRHKERRERIVPTTVREARFSDVDRLVELEFETFEDVYRDNPPNPNDVRRMIETRLGVVKELMIVGEVDGVIEGVMACQRTNKQAEEIRTWEETTDNGTLLGTHDEQGENFYIVNLAVSEKGSAHNLSDQLIARMIGKFVEAKCQKAYLLSRMPQFSQWLDEQNIEFDTHSSDVQDKLAEEYVKAKRVINGREQVYDGVLRRYMEVGVRPERVIRDGYTDPSSHNYSVLCVFENPLGPLRNSRAVSLLAGRALRFASEHPSLLKFLP